MVFTKLLAKKSRDLYGEPAVCMGFLGDSVTQGCFECYTQTPERMETIFDPGEAYGQKLRQYLQTVYPSVPVHVVNAGISGDCAAGGLGRLERDLLRYRPDLAVVCFGLNDSVTGVGEMAYAQALEGIFDSLAQRQVETIFMTPNMMATYVSPQLTQPLLIKNAGELVAVQTRGILAGYLAKAREVCGRMGVPVCDCYRRWEQLWENGADVTQLLANLLNHPTRQLHGLFAAELFRMLMEG